VPFYAGEKITQGPKEEREKMQQTFQKSLLLKISVSCLSCPERFCVKQVDIRKNFKGKNKKKVPLF